MHISTAKRLALGSAGSFAQLIVGLLIQVLAVPLYLLEWNAETYGLWLLIATSSTLISLLDVGHQNYLGYKMLQADSPTEVAKIASSAAPAGLAFGVIQLTVAALLYANAGRLGPYEPISAPLLIYSVSWFIFGSVGGIFGRTLPALGRNHRLIWWNVLNLLLQQLTPVVVCLAGGGLVEAAWGLFAATAAFNVLLWSDVARTWKANSLHASRPVLAASLQQAGRSLALGIREFLLLSRQHGFRLVLAPFMPPQMISAFSITRTAANVITQGLNTIYVPMEPELLRYTRERDYARFRVLFSAMVVAGTFLLAPVLVLMQMIAPFAFRVWTHNSIPYSPSLFAALSIGILLQSFAQPYATIVRGNNLLRAQLITSALTTAALILSAALLTPTFGMEGAGYALVLAETVNLVSILWVASRWAFKVRLPFPRTVQLGSFCVSAASTVCLFALGHFPSRMGLVAAVYLVFSTVTAALLLKCIWGHRHEAAELALLLKFTRRMVGNRMRLARL